MLQASVYVPDIYILMLFWLKLFKSSYQLYYFSTHEGLDKVDRAHALEPLNMLNIV